MSLQVLRVELYLPITFEQANHLTRKAYLLSWFNLICGFFFLFQGSLQQLIVAPDVFRVLSYCKMFTTDCDKPLPYAPFLSGAAQERRDSNVQIINNVRYVSNRLSSLCREKTLNKGDKILRR